MTITRAADRTLIGRPFRTTLAQRDNVIPFIGRLMADPAKTAKEAPSSAKSLESSNALGSTFSGEASCCSEPLGIGITHFPSGYAGSSGRSSISVLAGSLSPLLAVTIKPFSIPARPVVLPLSLFFKARRAQITWALIGVTTFETERSGSAFLIALFESIFTGGADDAFYRMIGTTVNTKPTGLPSVVLRFFRHGDSMGQGVYPVKPKDQPKWARTIPIEIKD